MRAYLVLGYVGRVADLGLVISLVLFILSDPGLLLYVCDRLVSLLFCGLWVAPWLTTLDFSYVVILIIASLGTKIARIALTMSANNH